MESAQRMAVIRPDRSDGAAGRRPARMVIFGASGDLTQRLLMPALYNLAGAPSCSTAFRDASGSIAVGLVGGRISARISPNGVRSFVSDTGGSGPPTEASIATPGHCLSGAHDSYRRRFDEPDTLRPARQAAGEYRARSTAPAATCCSIWRSRRRFFGAGRRAAGRSRAAARGERAAGGGSSSRSRSARPRLRARRSTRGCTRCWSSGRSIGSIISSARRRSRTSWCCASATASSSRCGTATTSTTCRSRWPRPWASSAAAASTKRPARCATWCRTTVSSC